MTNTDEHPHTRNSQANDHHRERDRRLGVDRAESVAHGFSRTADPADEHLAQNLAVAIARSLRDDRCEDVVVLDVRGLSQVTDFLLIASGTSNVQMRAAAANAVKLAKGHRANVLNDNVRQNEPSWLLVDLIDVVVHVFEPDTRDYYDLEMLWGDAPAVPWARDDDDDDGVAKRRNRARLAPGEAKAELERSGEHSALADEHDPEDPDHNDGRLP